MKNVTIRIPDMQSAHCRARVSNAVKSIEGVTLRNIDAGVAILTLAADTFRDEVIQAIEKAGYTIAGIEENG